MAKKKPTKKPKADQTFLERYGPDPLTDDVLDLVSSGLAKKQSGQEPTVPEKRAIAKFERHKEEKQRIEFYASVPQKHYRYLSGDRQTKQLQDTEQKYGIPCVGKKINLFAVIRAFHDLVAKNHRRILTEDEEGVLMAGGDSPALEEYRKWKAELVRMEVEQKKGTLCDVAEMRVFVDRLSDLLRDCGEQLAKHGDEESIEIYDETIDEIESLITDEFQHELDNPEISDQQDEEPEEFSEPEPGEQLDETDDGSAASETLILTIPPPQAPKPA